MRIAAASNALLGRMEDAQKAEARLRQTQADALLTAGDLTSPETRRLLVDRTLERYGTIDVLINNAGVGGYRPAWEMPMEEVRALMELNFFAALLPREP